jgi:hypothetical protein
MMFLECFSGKNKLKFWFLTSQNQEKIKKNILVKIVLIFLNHDVNKKACYYQNKTK